jgi:chromosome segregation ATPase
MHYIVILGAELSQVTQDLQALTTTHEETVNAKNDMEDELDSIRELFEEAKDEKELAEKARLDSLRLVQVNENSLRQAQKELLELKAALDQKIHEERNNHQMKILQFQEKHDRLRIEKTDAIMAKDELEKALGVVAREKRDLQTQIEILGREKSASLDELQSMNRQCKDQVLTISELNRRLEVIQQRNKSDRVYEKRLSATAVNTPQTISVTLPEEAELSETNSSTSVDATSAAGVSVMTVLADAFNLPE